MSARTAPPQAAKPQSASLYDPEGDGAIWRRSSPAGSPTPPSRGSSWRRAARSRRPSAEIVAVVFAETTTIGVRSHLVARLKLAALGMDYPTLRSLNSRLVYAGLTGYGIEGDDRDRAAFDYAAFWARSGIMASLGEPEGPPPTQRPGMGDHMTGLGLAGAIAAALFARERSGVGQEIGMSLFASGLWMLANGRSPASAAIAFAASTAERTTM